MLEKSREPNKRDEGAGWGLLEQEKSEKAGTTHRLTEVLTESRNTAL